MLTRRVLAVNKPSLVKLEPPPKQGFYFLPTMVGRVLIFELKMVIVPAFPSPPLGSQ